MPGFDHTGPNGDGPRTGRGLGDCKPNDNSSSNNDRPRGRGPHGRGKGRR